jgi:small subunit ribosomal protein S18
MVDRDRYIEDEESIEEGEDTGGRGGKGGRRMLRRSKVCAFCADGIKTIDYKQPEMLRRYLTDRGKIRPRRQTGMCARHQRRLSLAIKRARHLAMLPFTAEHTRG